MPRERHDFSLGPAPLYHLHALRKDDGKIIDLHSNDLTTIKREFREMQRSGKYTAITCDGFGSSKPKVIEPETLSLFNVD